MDDEKEMYNIMQGMLQFVSIIHYYEYQNIIIFYNQLKYMNYPVFLYIIKIGSKALWWYQQDPSRCQVGDAVQV